MYRSRIGMGGVDISISAVFYPLFFGCFLWTYFHSRLLRFVRLCVFKKASRLFRVCWATTRIVSYVPRPRHFVISHSTKTTKNSSVFLTYSRLTLFTIWILFYFNGTEELATRAVLVSGWGLLNWEISSQADRASNWRIVVESCCFCVVMAYELAKNCHRNYTQMDSFSLYR